MLYLNTFLDRLGELIRGDVEADAEVIDELTDEGKLVEMFRSDCEEILKMVEEGRVGEEEARRNLSLLKSYVVTQLSIHYEKVKEIAESKGIVVDKSLRGEVVNEIAMIVDEAESRLSQTLK